MNDTFNPMDWIEDEQPKKTEQPKRQETAKQPSTPPTDISSEVDTVISRIETALTDITTSYQDWLNVGFVFANEFGEGGRGLFHRVSKYYSGYTKAGTDRQFDQCLKSTPSSRCITIRTFFHLAKQAGIDVNTNESWQESNTVHIDLPTPDLVELPTLPDFIFEQLPEFLQKVVEGS